MTRIRDATIADIPIIETMIFDNFKPLFYAWMGSRSPEAIKQTLIALRMTHAEPVQGFVIVENEDGQTLGIGSYQLGHKPQPSLSKRLRALRPLGLFGALRFIALTKPLAPPVGPQKDEAVMRGMAVNRDLRSKGIGTLILRETTDHAFKAGCSRCIALVANVNKASQMIALKNGYTQVDTIETPMRARLLNESSIFVYALTAAEHQAIRENEGAVHATQ